MVDNNFMIEEIIETLVDSLVGEEVEEDLISEEVVIEVPRNLMSCLEKVPSSLSMLLLAPSHTDTMWI